MKGHTTRIGHFCVTIVTRLLRSFLHFRSTQGFMTNKNHINVITKDVLRLLVKYQTSFDISVSTPATSHLSVTTAQNSSPVEVI